MRDQPSPDERLTYDEVDLVLRRATELQHGDPKGEGSFSLTEVQRLGQEIGLSPQAVKAALVHVRSGALAPMHTPKRSLLDPLVGPREVVVRRRVRGPVGEVWARVNLYMKDQLFTVRRNYGQRVLWGSSEGLLSQFRRALDVGDRYTLRGADEVETGVLELATPDEVEVVLAARFGNERRSLLIGGAVVFGLLTTVAGLAALPLMAISTTGAAALLAGGAGVGGLATSSSWRSHRKKVSGIQMALERLLDALEHER